jgi:hypothetical protein
MQCSSLELNCFPREKLFIFLLSSVVLPYTTYLLVADKMNWTRRRFKSPGQHFETLLISICVMVLIWTFGNYEKTFNHITVVGILIGVVGFGYLAEPHYARHTLADVEKWSREMKQLVFNGVIFLILVGWYHINLAKTVSSKTFFFSYCLSLFIPIILVYMSIETTRIQNSLQGQPKIRLHVHHLHLFLILSFFTRFPDNVSRFCAGLFIGAGMHGASAYGFDTIFDVYRPSERISHSQKFFA